MHCRLLSRELEIFEVELSLKNYTQTGCSPKQQNETQLGTWNSTLQPAMGLRAWTAGAGCAGSRGWLRWRAWARIRSQSSAILPHKHEQSPQPVRGTDSRNFLDFIRLLQQLHLGMVNSHSFLYFFQKQVLALVLPSYQGLQITQRNALYFALLSLFDILDRIFSFESSGKFRSIGFILLCRSSFSVTFLP